MRRSPRKNNKKRVYLENTTNGIIFIKFECIWLKLECIWRRLECIWSLHKNVFGRTRKISARVQIHPRLAQESRWARFGNYGPCLRRKAKRYRWEPARELKRNIGKSNDIKRASERIGIRLLDSDPGNSGLKCKDRNQIP